MSSAQPPLLARILAPATEKLAYSVRGVTESVESSCRETEAVVETKEEVKAAFTPLINKWTESLNRRVRSLSGFSLSLLYRVTQSIHSFISTFNYRPGMLKLRLVNGVVELLTLAIHTVLWLLVVGAACGALLALIKLLLFLGGTAMDWIGGDDANETLPDEDS